MRFARSLKKKRNNHSALDLKAGLAQIVDKKSFSVSAAETALSALFMAM